MMMNVGELNRASSQQCQPHARLLVSGSLSLGSSRKSGLLWGRSGACSVCLLYQEHEDPTKGPQQISLEVSWTRTGSHGCSQLQRSLGK